MSKARDGQKAAAKALIGKKIAARKPKKKLEHAPGKVSDKQFNLILDLMRDGVSRKRAMQAANVPKELFRNYVHASEERKQLVEDAKFEGIDELLDETIDIADCAVDRETAAAATVRINARQTYAKMINQKRFNVQQHKISGDSENPLTVGVVVVPAKQPAPETLKQNAKAPDAKPVAKKGRFQVTLP